MYAKSRGNRAVARVWRTSAFSMWLWLEFGAFPSSQSACGSSKAHLCLVKVAVARVWPVSVRSKCSWLESGAYLAHRHARHSSHSDTLYKTNSQINVSSRCSWTPEGSKRAPRGLKKSPLITRSSRCSLILHRIRFNNINIVNQCLLSVFLDRKEGSKRAPRSKKEPSDHKILSVFFDFSSH